MNSLLPEKLTIKDIERKFFEIGCEIARTLLQNFLELTDKELMETRNKAELRHKGTRKTTLKTLMGEVEIKRVIYKKYKEDGSTEHIYLLDEALGLYTIGKISPNLAEKILEFVCEMSYREVSEAVCEFTNQTISHQTAWDIVQTVGEKQAEDEEELVKSYENYELSGEKEIPVLFEEADGLWLSIQRRNRKSSRKEKKELKIAAVYKLHPLSRTK